MPHPIFEQFPLRSEPVQTSTGPQPTPYHVYDAHAVLIGGTADYAAVARVLASEQVTPAQTTSGRALMAVWAVDEPSASHGPHTELQFSFYVAHGKQKITVKDGPFAALQFLLSRAEGRQMCYGLWNNTAEVVAYNSEILGLTPRLMRSEFSFPAGRVQFAFYDAQSGALLARGDVHHAKNPPLDATIALFRNFGFGAALRAASMKTIETKVVNPISPHLPRNADAPTIASPDALIPQLFDPRQDKLTIAVAPYAQLDFQPTFVEHLRGFKMVYLTPEK